MLYSSMLRQDMVIIANLGVLQNLAQMAIATFKEIQATDPEYSEHAEVILGKVFNMENTVQSFLKVKSFKQLEGRYITKLEEGKIQLVAPYRPGQISEPQTVPEQKKYVKF